MARTKQRQPQRNVGTVAIYARVSSQGQAEDDRTSLPEQVGDMGAHCEDRGLTKVKRCLGVGPGQSKNRPDFQWMLVDARLGLFDTIVCWKSDRLTRGMFPAAALMEVWKPTGSNWNPSRTPST